MKAFRFTLAKILELRTREEDSIRTDLAARTAVADGLSGVLVPGHDPADYARAISELLGDPVRLAGMAIAARAHAEQFGWAGTTAGLMSTYGKALAAFRRGAQGPEGRVLATV